MSRSVIVLCPNNRRQTVVCTINTSLLHILEEVCQREGLEVEMYDIKHHNKVLDTSIPFRFSGLPNNAHLELAVTIKGHYSSRVIVAVFLEDVRRVFGHFLPETSLYNVLETLCANELNTQPVPIYMSNAIWGEKLKTTTLRNLGLTSGKAMFRLVHRSPQELAKPDDGNQIQNDDEDFSESTSQDSQQASSSDEFDLDIISPPLIYAMNTPDVQRAESHIEDAPIYGYGSPAASSSPTMQMQEEIGEMSFYEVTDNAEE